MKRLGWRDALRILAENPGASICSTVLITMGPAYEILGPPATADRPRHARHLGPCRQDTFDALHRRGLLIDRPPRGWFLDRTKIVDPELTAVSLQYLP